MLFALDWIKKTWDAMVSAISGFTGGLDLFSISAALREFWLVAAASVIAGIILCFLGFRFHKFVHGAIGSVLSGVLGWHLAQIMNNGQITVSIVYAIIFAIIGFFIMYLCYFLDVFMGSYLLFFAMFAPVSSFFRGYRGAVTLLLGILYSALYIKYKLYMTSLSGSILLALVFFGILPTSSIAIVIVIALTFAGIYIQRIMRCRYEKHMAIAMQEQIEKYPYGPGIVYGWEDPTVSSAREK